MFSQLEHQWSLGVSILTRQGPEPCDDSQGGQQFHVTLVACVRNDYTLLTLRFDALCMST